MVGEGGNVQRGDMTNSIRSFAEESVFGMGKLLRRILSYRDLKIVKPLRKHNLPFIKFILAALWELGLESNWEKGDRQARETLKARRLRKSC